MIDSLKEIVSIIKDLPTYAIWILAGFLFYKMTIVGSIYGVIRLFINRVYQWATSEKKLVISHDINGRFYNTSGRVALEGLLDRIVRDNSSIKDDYIPYIGKREIDEIAKAYEKLRAEEKEAEEIRKKIAATTTIFVREEGRSK